MPAGWPCWHCMLTPAAGKIAVLCLACEFGFNQFADRAHVGPALDLWFDDAHNLAHIAHCDSACGGDSCVDDTRQFIVA